MPAIVCPPWRCGNPPWCSRPGVQVHRYNTANASVASRRSPEVVKAWKASTTTGLQATANLDPGVPEIGLMAWVLTNKRYG
jgi:hypothetical protein